MKKSLFTLVLLVTIQPVFSQQVAKVKQNDIFGYLNKDGSWLIKPQYIKAGNFSNGVAPVFNGEKWGFINGNLLADTWFQGAEKFTELKIGVK